MSASAAALARGPAADSAPQQRVAVPIGSGCDILTDAETVANAQADPAAPPTTAADWRDAVVVPPRAAKPLVSLRIDRDVVEWFRATGRGYQTRMNAVLRAYVEHQRKQ